MNQEEVKNAAIDIVEKLIQICEEGNLERKKFLELYNELLSDEQKKYKTEILSYIPEILAVKGYEIGNGDYFRLEKY